MTPLEDKARREAAGDGVSVLSRPLIWMSVFRVSSVPLQTTKQDGVAILM
jgi:hypothetical protein